MQALERGVGGAICFQAFNHAYQHGVGFLDGVVGMLRQRARQVGGCNFGLAQCDIVRIPAAPHFDRHQRSANQHHEDGCKKGDG